MSFHFLQSQSINPANLLELKVLSQIVNEQQSNGKIADSIPYLAKICQIVDNQRADTPEHRKALLPIRAEAHTILGDAYFKSMKFVQCEATLTTAAQLWEKIHHGNTNSVTPPSQLVHIYDVLCQCYEALGKSQMAVFMEKRKAKLLSTAENEPEADTAQSTQ